VDWTGQVSSLPLISVGIIRCVDSIAAHGIDGQQNNAGINDVNDIIW